MKTILVELRITNRILIALVLASFVYRRLQEAGMESSQAEALAQAQRDALNETLDDIYEIRATLKLHGWMLTFNLLLSFAMLSMLAALLLGK